MLYYRQLDAVILLSKLKFMYCSYVASSLEVSSYQNGSDLEGLMLAIYTTVAQKGHIKAISKLNISIF